MKVYDNDNFTTTTLTGNYNVQNVCNMYPELEKLRVIDFGYFSLDDLIEGDYPTFTPSGLDVRQYEQSEVVIAILEKNTLVCVI